jgi:photosystem II stability/assembly factor-like uncharacterized protein
MHCLALDPRNPHRIYAGTQDAGVLRSLDRGRSWQPAGLIGKVVRSIAVSPHKDGLLYAGTKPALMYVSRDGGDSWRELEGFRQIRWRWLWRSPAEWPFTAYVQTIALSAEAPEVIIAGIEAGAVVRSQDAGLTWSGHCKGADRDPHTLAFHAADGRWAYEAGGGGPAVSRDAGRTWHKPRAGLDRRYCWSCAGDPERPEVWYVSAAPSFSLRHFAPVGHIDGQANTYIFRSVGGAAWEKLGGGLPRPLDHMAYALLTDPGAPGHLYAGLSNGQVWHSPNHGDSWRQLPLSLGSIRRTLILLT